MGVTTGPLKQNPPLPEPEELAKPRPPTGP